MIFLTRLMLYICFLFASLPATGSETGTIPDSDPDSVLFPASQLPLEEPTDKFTGELYNMLITLGMVIGVIFALSWFLKRFLNAKVQQDNANSNIKVLERRSLSTKSGIYLLEVYGKILVIAESPAGFQHLTTINHPPDSSSFEKILDRKP